MPIGLEEESYARQCDLELRKRLGSNTPRVYLAHQYSLPYMLLPMPRQI